MKVNSVLAPVMAVGDELECLARQWMVRMYDFKGTVDTVAIRCS